jgi:hypothetical protein
MPRGCWLLLLAAVTTFTSKNYPDISQYSKLVLECFKGGRKVSYDANFYNCQTPLKSRDIRDRKKARN